jgi:hypothetical protein
MEGVKLTVTSDSLFQIFDLGQRWVLAACAKEIAKGVERDAAGSTLVKQLECFLVVR